VSFCSTPVARAFSLTVFAAALAFFASGLIPSGARAAAPSGQAMPSGNLTDFRQIFSDDFNTDVATGSFPGNAYKSRWAVYPDGGLDTFGVAKHAPSKILHVNNSLLTWDFHTEGGYPLIANPLPRITAPGADAYKGIAYGRFTVRIRSSQLAAGYMPVFLLWPDSNKWPAQGEIDWPGGDLTKTISATFIHAHAGSAIRDPFQTSARWNTWHTVTIDWQPGIVRFYLDGAVVGTSTSEIPKDPMHWVLQVDSTEGGPKAAANAVGDLQVDWVSVWAYAPGTVATISPPDGEPVATGGGKVSIRATSGKCKKSRTRAVSGTIAVTFPRHARKRKVSFSGARVRKFSSLNTKSFTNGNHKLFTAYTKKHHRVRGCRWLKVAN
jgi:hypothetical protein